MSQHQPQQERQHEPTRESIGYSSRQFASDPGPHQNYLPRKTEREMLTSGDAIPAGEVPLIEGESSAEFITRAEAAKRDLELSGRDDVFWQIEGKGSAQRCVLYANYRILRQEEIDARGFISFTHRIDIRHATPQDLEEWQTVTARRNLRYRLEAREEQERQQAQPAGKRSVRNGTR